MWREKSEPSPSHGTAQVFKTIYGRKRRGGEGTDRRGGDEKGGSRRDGEKWEANFRVHHVSLLKETVGLTVLLFNCSI